MKLKTGKNLLILIQIFGTILLAIFPASTGKIITMTNYHGIGWKCNPICNSKDSTFKKDSACTKCCKEAYSDSTLGKCFPSSGPNRIQNGKVVKDCKCMSFKKLETKPIPNCKNICLVQGSSPDWNCVECCRKFNKMWNGGKCVPGYFKKSKPQCYCEFEIQPKKKNIRGSRSLPTSGSKYIGLRRNN